MNMSIRQTRLALAVSLGLGVLALTACQTAPVQDPDVIATRAELTQLQGNANLASRAPNAIKDADIAVTAAEAPQSDRGVKAHLEYLAEDKVRTAKALSQARYAEDQLKTISAKREKVQLDARTQEADKAHAQLAGANAATAAAQGETVIAQQQAAASDQQAGFDSQRANAADARSATLEQQLADLHAVKTERGTVFTLSDVVFATGKSDLKPGATADFDRLAAALAKQPDRHITVEGHTDSVGSESSNMALSQRRAESVMNYLVSHGVSADRITAIGKGKEYPVTSNSTAAGRQKNRRVEVIIENAPAAITNAGN